MADALCDRALEQPERLAFVFLENGESESGRLTYGDLHARASVIAAFLARSTRPGDRALLLFPPGLEFITAFFGCFYSGVIAVPAYPPSGARDRSRLVAILRDAAPRVVLTTAAIQARAAAILAPDEKSIAPVWQATADLPAATDELARPRRLESEAIAFLQYTSGSTGEPRGVVVSHGNLLDNEEAIHQVFRTSRDSLVLGWLPLYHDMGLVGNVLQPIYVGAACILMSPVAFLQRPRRWLEATSRYRATTSGGPNFAYDLCVRKIAPAEREGLDLRSWEVAFNGAEPVRAETLERFAEAFAAAGFARRAFRPCYGLAESTLLVAGNTGNDGSTGSEGSGVGAARSWNRAALENGRATAAVGPGSIALVSSGRPLAEQRLLVVDPKRRIPCAPGEVGEVWLQGPSVAQGYWNRPEESRETFSARLADGSGGDFLRTGDLGFLAADGELFLTGRLKDLIIIRGRNHYPQDIERTVERSHPALRPGHIAAIGIEEGGEERLVVVSELGPRVRELAAGDAAAITTAVRQSIAAEHELHLHELVLIPAGRLPMTTSAKVRRRACRELLLAGELQVVARARTAGEPREVGAEAPGSPTVAAALDDGRDDGRRQLLSRLRRQVAGMLGIDEAAVDTSRPLVALGLDSLAMIELGRFLEVENGEPPALAYLLEEATLENLAARSPGAESAAAPSAEDAAPDPPGEMPLSHGQRALWFLEQLAPGSGAYHLAAAARVTPAFARAPLERALHRLAGRHSALRSVFVAVDGEPRQRVLPEPTPALSWWETGGWTEEERRRLVREEASRPYDLTAGPLSRVAVLADGAEQILVLGMHHLIADFSSLAVVVRELGELYREEAQGVPSALPPAPGSAAFVRWQNRWLASGAAQEARAYWETTLAGAAELDLPTDRPHPAVRSFRGGEVSLRLEAAVATALGRWAQSRGATLFMALLAGFKVLLARYTGQEDVVVGTASSGRRSARFAGIVGYLINALAVRSDLSGEPDIDTLLARVQTAVLGAFAHQDLPLSLLAEWLQPERDAGRAPFYETLLILHQAERRGEEALAAFALGDPGAHLELPDHRLESLAAPRAAAQVDLSLAAATLDGTLALRLEYNSDVFDPTTASRLLGHFASLLGTLAAGPAVRVTELPFLAAAERAQALLEWNDTAALAPSHQLLHERVDAQARRTPEALALVTEGGSLTYGELLRRAHRLAHFLVSAGVGPEVRVGVALPRTASLVVAILGVLAAGGAYVPLDPEYPRERLDLMLADSGAALLLTDGPPGAEAPRFGGRVVRLGQEGPARSALPAVAPRRAALPESLAYVIYTSGSTGRPKGVAITHRSAVSFVEWALQSFSDGELGRVLAVTSVCFDLSVFELFVPLAAGGAVVLARHALEVRRTPGVAEVTLINTVPSVLVELLSQGILPAALAVVNLAGEPLAAEVRRRADGCRVYNLYGPSEDTTYSTWAEVASSDPRPPAIGRPILATRAHVLDRRLGVVPLGVVGELFLGGAGLARGYLAQPDKTAERFLPDPWGGLSGQPGARLYRTGDLARRRADGILEFLGRFDQQVKLRGHRIELGEVEQVLASHPAVHQAVALLLRSGPEGEPALVACVAGGGEPAALRRELQAVARAQLPVAMAPSRIVVMGALPSTPSGKVDRQAVAALAAAATLPAEAEPAAPSTPAEELLAAILAATLGCERLGVDDDFFAAGGHSLLASRALARIAGSFGVDLPLSAFFEAPTAARLARRVEAAAGEHRPPLPPILPAPRTAALPLSDAQLRLWFLNQLEPETAAYHLAGEVSLRGELRPALLAAALAAILERHEALRTSFPTVAGEPVQRIAPAASLPPLPMADLAILEAAGREREAVELARRWAGKPFSLADGPLVRLLLLRLAGSEHRLIIVLHHIVADGDSLAIFWRELVLLYRSLAEGGGSPLPPPALQYGDFAVWQRQVRDRSAVAEQRAWWRRQLAGAAASELPMDRARPAVRGDRGARQPLALAGPASLSALRALCRDQQVTLYMACLAAFVTLITRYGGDLDTVIGTPVATRSSIETEGMIGLLINTLVLRIDLAADPSGEELLRRVRQAVLAAFAHRDVPFEQVIEELQPGRSFESAPLFRLMFTFLAGAPGRAEAAGVTLDFADIDTGTSKFDLSLWVRDAGTGLATHLVYACDLFEAATATRLAAHLGNLLAGLADDPRRRLSELPLLAAAQRHQLSVEWASDASPRPPRVYAAEQLEGQAALQPGAPALLCGSGEVSFLELNRRANRLAGELRRLGVGPEGIVGLYADRSPETVVAVLGIWKAGGAYLPLDPSHPPERLAGQLEDAAAKVLITRPERFVGPAGGVVLDLGALALPGSAADDRGPGVALLGESLAYVIYTSGSGGRPKGVMVRHRSVANLGAALRASCYAGRGRSRVGINASLAFDSSVKQLIQILHGDALAILPEEVRRDGRSLLAYLDQTPLDVLDCTPSQLELLRDPLAAGGAMPDLLLVGGEVIGEPLWRGLADAARAGSGAGCWNVYGPTECTVDATACRITAGRPRLGRPLANVQVVVLDGASYPVPLGGVGEICIGGEGLARGYLARPDLTAASFLPNPFAGRPGDRLYRTGDLGRFLPDGAVELLGRADRQVKIRGFRVELGEIESWLAEHPMVERAVAALQEEGPGERRLVAFVARRGDSELEEAELEEEGLRAFLRRRLPEAALPSRIVAVDRFVLTPNGKVDRRALPAVSPRTEAAERVHVAPRNAVEESLAAIWRGLLKLERVGIDESFFDLGGHSLVAAQMIARIRLELGAEVALRELFEGPTIAALATAVAAARGRASAGATAPASAPITAGRRARRDLTQLIGEFAELSAEEVSRELRERKEGAGR